MKFPVFIEKSTFFCKVVNIIVVCIPIPYFHVLEIMQRGCSGQKDLPGGDKKMEKSNIKVVKRDDQKRSHVPVVPTQEIAATVKDWVVEIRRKREAEMENSKNELFPPPIDSRRADLWP